MSQNKPKTQESDSKTAQNDGKRVTSEYILEILEQFGPSARLLIVAPDMHVMEALLLNNVNGLLNTKYGFNFSGNWKFRQMTHMRGGVVYLATYTGIVRDHQIEGLIFTHAWLEDPPTKKTVWPATLKLINDRMKRPDGNFIPLILESYNGMFTPES